ncbi:hypothetical protein B0H63DRAFT_213226 [Podospora didyma]|uniref:Uncharacterized protein n=1 Tax=Podospora didyma TaxID=330526 RepID=A0AAE0NHS5_9PEZI|nr:hypothetical protein B0H63DRAFT_213226 [Podospora didyma]
MSSSSSSTPTKEELDGLYIGSIVLNALWIVPLAILFGISICFARRKADPARDWLNVLKLAYPFFIVALLFFAIGYGLSLYVRTAPATTWAKDPLGESYVSEAAFRLVDLGRFWEFLGDIVLIFALVELGSGILHANTGAPSPARKWLKWSAFGWAVFFFILALSLMAFNQSFWSNTYKFQRAGVSGSGVSMTTTEYKNLGRKLITDFKTRSKLEGSLNIILWISSLPVLGYAAYIVFKTRSNSLLRNSALLFLSAVVLDVVRLLCNMAIFSNLYLGDTEDTINNISQDTRTFFGVGLIASPLLDNLPMFLVFGFLFVLSIRKLGGVWSTEQPQWGIAAVTPPEVQPAPYMVQQTQPGWQQQVPTQPYPYQYPPQQQQQQVPQQYYYAQQQAPAPAYQQPPSQPAQQPYSDPKYAPAPIPTPTQPELQTPPAAPKSPASATQAELQATAPARQAELQASPNDH